MKTSEYKLNGDVPEVVKGSIFTFHAAESLEDMQEQVKDNDVAHVVNLAQASLDITRQRLARSYAGSEDVAAILSGKAEGTADLDDAERKDAAVAHIQAKLDEYIYGSRPAGTGEGAKTKKQAKVGAAVLEAAAADPELLARLKALGIELPEA